MVPYQPTPARLILALLQEIRPTERDVFVDVGSGWALFQRSLMLTARAPLGLNGTRTIAHTRSTVSAASTYPQ